MKLVTGDQMRSFDNTVIRKYGVPGIVLMENAAIRIAEEIRKRYAPLKGQRISIVCGKGNNGGDGLALARQLATIDRADVNVWLAEPMDQASPDTAVNLMITRNYGIPVETIADPEWFLAHLRASNLVVDAVLGTGIVGNPRPAATVAIENINQCGRPVISIDIPSGLNSENGDSESPTVQATVTITLAMPKIGLALYPGAALAGELVVADIGFPPEFKDDQSIKTILTERSEISTWLPSRSASRDANKGKFGSVAVVAGSPGFLGSACLAAEGAGRSGAGLVTLAVPESIFASAMARAPEPIMTHPLPASPAGSFDASGVHDALKFVTSRSVVAFGCGAGHDDSVREFARQFIAGCQKPLVIDADALTILSLESDRGQSLVRGRKFPTVLTPHPGEMARLLGIGTADVQKDRLKAVREASAYYAAVVVLKGQASLVASPDGRLAVNPTGNPGMGTGGSGDVLTGVCASFLSQIDDPWEAIAAAVFVHGLAGDLASKSLGEVGILATDIAQHLSKAIAACYE